MKGWYVGDRAFVWGERTYIMGILNITPDSFSDGGDFFNPASAVAHAFEMVAAGVDVIDIGGESTRPGASEVPISAELARVLPVIEGIRQQSQIPISIDTTHAVVARAAVEAGANIVNDVSGGQADPEMFATVAALGVPYILMHRRGTPATMQHLTDYGDLIGDLLRYFQEQTQRAIASGIPPEHLMIDPGIGFAKTTPQNLTLLRELRQFHSLGYPLLLGPSRKRFIGDVLNLPNPKDRVWGTAAVCCHAIAQGVEMVRVHDVAAMVQVCRMADVLWRSP
ncbi:MULTISPECIES: dihydropteroate synthase [unclassified Thermosynechococcus]|uniref:dihydropteroate synthase n=1 Tax=unclassified Thermosynechococcus TaxID=2622553 RepID=UPI0026734493|nr:MULTISPECIES: dihydropteroate synthase [unclassified Thermosynechococcus]MDR7922929.1 dihydropteroate synthase [Thermosynechococcus sp. HY213]WKT81053.1 dihydropteroate synthase [Thermosynechococcus sp. PP45]WNC24664.1 dihydropteroate synthase [Thermosynechococcus sp. PP551]WNC27242.1 dihydropteroate synthase [Thermosynechococcus sp. PP555]WNC29792.1 dihydropteroate synthase [Thermosynechococcus sp. PKX82]